MESNNAEENPESGVRKFFASVVDNLRTIIYAVLIALVVRTFAYEPFNIPSGSMIPTLLVGDYLFVSKFSYGYSRHSFPFSFPPFSGRLFSDQPARGDVAVFKLPSDNRTDYIKRIVGLPGDKIQVISGVLHINGEPVRRRRIEDYAHTDNGRITLRAQQFVETLPEGRRHLLIEEAGDFGELDNTPEFVVPQGHYFAMGDNRDNSSDSRVMASVGFVPAENLVGRAEFLFFSIEPGVRFWEIWKWPFAIRFGRLFDGIE
ncbi:MAG: signal peptidase I [Rhodospirillales bacterium]|jgi:signal peptidase I|nr:signal peptidase I [Rhodospirillales bacterium]